MPTASPVLLLLASACIGEFGLDTGIEVGDDSEVEEAACKNEAVCIEDLDPAWGPKEGGTAVEVSGWGFTDAPVVKFGSYALDSVISFDDGRLVITTPASAVDGAVDVTVESSEGSYTAYDAFVYADQDPDVDTDTDADSDTDTDTDTDVTPSGDVMGAVEMSYLAYACPDIYGLTDALQFSVAAVFHDPVTGSWYDDLPAEGSCEANSAPSPLASSFKDLGSWAYLNTGSKSISLQRTSQNGQPYYLSGSLAQGDLVKNAFFDLNVPDGSLDVTDVLLTPSDGFTSITPLAIANDCNSAFAAQIFSTAATFQWAPTGVAESMIIDLQIYNSQGTSFLGSVTCHSSDSGSATVPQTMLSSYPKNSLVVVNMWRRQVESAVDPASGHTLEGAAVLGIVGTGTLK